jgi:hypothetical protein
MVELPRRTGLVALAMLTSGAAAASGTTAFDFGFDSLEGRLLPLAHSAGACCSW